MARKGNPCTLLVAMQIGVTILENGMEVPKKINNRTTVSFSNSIFEYLIWRK